MTREVRRQPPKGREYAKAAAAAHSDLIQFAIIEKICEGSDLSVPARETAAKIVALCKLEMTRAVNRYDAALSKCPEASQ